MKKLLFFVFLFTTISFSQSSAGALSEDFKTFWKSFQSDVLNNDINGIISKTKFPFEYKAESTLMLSVADFKNRYEDIIYQEIINSMVYIQDDSEIDYENEYLDFIYASLSDDGTDASFGIVVESAYISSTTLFFKKINGKYYFVKVLNL